MTDARKALHEPSQVSDDDIVRVIDWLMWLARGVSNLKKPESDNNYGRAAVALALCLPTDHPLHPSNALDFNHAMEMVAEYIRETEKKR